MSPASYPADAVAAQLVETDVLGICVFDLAGEVQRIYGAARRWAPPVGGVLEQAPLFVGLAESLQRLAEEGGSLLLPSVRAHGEPDAFDLRIFRLPDSDLMAAVSIDATGRLDLYRAAAQDLRDRRLLQDTVARQQEVIADQARLMRLFVERVPAAVAMIDIDLNEVLTSERWRALAQDGLADAAALRDRAEALRLSMENGVSTTRLERLATAEGAVLMRWEQTPWRGADGAVAGAFVFVENVTAAEERAARLLGRVRDLERGQREWRQLADDLAAHLSGVFERLRAGGSPQVCERSVEDARLALAAAQDYVRLTTRRLDFRPVELRGLVEAALAELAPLAAERGARVAIGDLPQMRGDPELLVALFRALLDNALKHAGPAPSILVEGERHGAGLEVRVVDDGPGVPSEMRGRPAGFFQRDPGASAPGAGMGLALCRRIVERHGGVLTIDPAWDAGLRVVLSFSGRQPGRRRERGAEAHGAVP
ncbi:MAG TPA: ATP-binding protein [Beijerinckiaceae bacterium]|jgi:signal transduction histidine kinase